MLPVNKKRVEELIGGLAKFGRTDAGITRLAYTSTDKAAQMWLLKQIEYLNLEVREDVLGTPMTECAVLSAHWKRCTCWRMKRCGAVLK